MVKQIKIFSGTSNRILTNQICQFLNMEPGKVDISRFKSGEIYVRYQEPLRTCDIFIVHSLSHPINENIVELLVMIDAAKRASAQTINLIIPYFGYARHARKKAPREPITAKMIADILTKVGADRVITVDLNSDAIQGFFKIPVDHLTVLDLMTQKLNSLNIPNPVVVSPDAARAKMTEVVASRLDVPFAIMINNKRQGSTSQVQVIGEVEGRTPIIVDDIIDTGRTVLNVVDELAARGANKAYVIASHGLLSDDCVTKLTDNSNIEHVMISDTIEHDLEGYPKFSILSMAEIFGTAVQIIAEGGSIDKLVNRKK
ncbi:ribose-phosphate diphosphokinase [Paenibacillus sambharensis]|uniref:ribose-phosphate diphosphokinase n=1 Tax=Paenibacillus sambharensis TaxID=1803190 RepID=A0A2W1LK06_9BACL|nr:ribose-phosphate pyrophosphokinase [Paenibacillus sambharensis]PZD95342.1 ribose-phosphate diphosphokinase [Paenibacillus sambharensis]